MRQRPEQGSGRVLVLAGGLSHERDVSMRSGRRVTEALRHQGLDADQRDVDAALLPALQADPPSCVVPVVHGESGEDGALREVLELLHLPYVGAIPRACRFAFDKPVASALVEAAGLAVPASVVLPAQTFREVGAPAVMAALLKRLGLPLVVKPTRGGSALGCQVVRDAADLPGAMVQCFSYGPVALVQRFVSGTEVAVGVVEDSAGASALPAVAIRPDSGVYDFAARYTAGATEFEVPAPVSDTVAQACADAARTAHVVLGLRDLSRTDLIIDDAGIPWFLEVNVAPGMTETSLVPLAIEQSGRTLGAVMADLVARAQAR
jgi:D-alanine-D-alanine ligase